MSDLGDSIEKKVDAQQKMLARFGRTKSKSFNTVDIRPQKGKARDDKGLVVPKINYIEDGNSDETSR